MELDPNIPFEPLPGKLDDIYYANSCTIEQRVLLILVKTRDDIKSFLIHDKYDIERFHIQVRDVLEEITTVGDAALQRTPVV